MWSCCPSEHCHRAAVPQAACSPLPWLLHSEGKVVSHSSVLNWCLSDQMKGTYKNLFYWLWTSNVLGICSSFLFLFPVTVKSVLKEMKFSCSYSIYRDIHSVWIAILNKNRKASNCWRARISEGSSMNMLIIQVVKLFCCLSVRLCHPILWIALRRGFGRPCLLFVIVEWIGLEEGLKIV